MDALAAALDLVEGGVDAPRLARLTVERARTLLETDAVWLYAWDGEANILSPLAYSDPAPPQPLPVARPGQGAIGLAFQRREPVVVDDYQKWDQALTWGKDRHTGSVIAVPLLAGEQTVGVLFAKSSLQRHIAPEEVTRVSQLAARVAPAFERVQRHAEAERRRGEAEALAELMRQGAAETDTDRVIDLVTEYAGLLLGADYTLVELTAPDGATTVQGCWGSRSGAWRTVRSVAGASNRALAAGRTLIIERLGENPRYPPAEFPVHCGEGGRTVLIARLVSRQLACGVLGVGWRSDVLLRPAQVRLAETLAGYAATMIDNARARARELRLMREAAARVEELAASEAALARLSRHTELILAAAADGIYGLDRAGRTTFINPAAARMIGYEPAELLGQMQHDILHHSRADGSPYPQRTCPIYATLAGGVTHHVTDEVFWRKDGTPFPIEYTSTPIHEDGALVGAVVTFKDITERKQAEAALAHQALHDALTGLPNRALLHDRLEQALRGAARVHGTMAVLLMDLNRFKEVNDTLGHHYGDLLLQQVGARVQAALRATDTVARLGGDEFAILLTTAEVKGAVRAAEKILAALAAPMTVEGQRLTAGASIGIALSPQHGTDAAALLRRADVAMYGAKRAGSGYAVYDPAHDQHSPARLMLEVELRQAIAQDHLVLHYQPKVDLKTGCISRVEALVRWLHPQRGLIPPDQFIPLAEQTGLITPLTHWVLEAALRQCQNWQRVGLRLGMAVNLSMRTLHDPQLADTIAWLLRRYEIAPERLTLEITESSLMADPTRAKSVLTRLADLGVGIAIDDFGTGYSSLAYLKHLPVGEIKIDRSFVLRMSEDAKDAAIVRSINDLSHNLGLQVVAEGVENRAVWDLLADLGCDMAQGYYLSRPVGAAELEHWVREHAVQAS